MADTGEGNCYICGVKLGKTAMKNHILKTHTNVPNGETCYLLKIEGAQDKKYWLFIDVAIDKSLSVLDSFLRKIWLECCGHLSAFHINGGDIGKNRKINNLAIGDKIIHEYDFGSTTETLITVIDTTQRLKQRDAVRLIARNIPPTFTCTNCGKPAEYICAECTYDTENPFYCDNCCEKHNEEHSATLPVTNSPRMGECGYDGTEDT
ncbi:MAG: hypothetical protein FWD52_03475 [Candidatus Bathyarchaeota archaeon]|nr:hypothetical protein [Candidatus Termiticorpusculum sp.]